jgi:hypothetical protein
MYYRKATVEFLEYSSKRASSSMYWMVHGAVTQYEPQGSAMLIKKIRINY